jgi:hypothetical protein
MRRNRRTRVKRYDKILGQVRDVEGGNWDVRQIRNTKHGFDLLFGSPDDHGSYRGGLPRLIATQSLADFWEAHRTKRDGMVFDLPAGRTTLKRVRRRLGFNVLDDVMEFWKERIEDLGSLKPREFAVRHGVNPLVVFDRRQKMLGRRARQLGWWRTDRTIEILLSDVTLREMGEKLGIGTSQAFRLRLQARAEMAGSSSVCELQAA